MQIINPMKLTVNMQTFLHVPYVRHFGTTVTQVTVISGLGVLQQTPLCIP